jgi:hypothetical protein
MARSSMPFYFFHQTGEKKMRKFDEKLFAIYSTQTQTIEAYVAYEDTTGTY